MTKKKKLENNWLRELIPDRFSDLDYLYASVLYKGLVFFWTKDDGEKTLRYQWEHVEQMRAEQDADYLSETKSWDDRYDHFKIIYDELAEAYTWATGFDDRMNRSYDSIKERQRERELDDKHLANIIKHRCSMWT